MKRLILMLLLLLPAAPAHGATTPKITHVVVVAMENHSLNQVIGSSSAPYITGLAHTYGYATGVVNIAHPSLPNYLAVTGGSTAGVTSDCSPSSSCGSSGASVFSQLGTNWRSYEESMPKACDKANATPYAVRHNPAVYYRTLASCATRDVVLPATLDLSPALTFVTPNLCHDMHSNSCSGSSCVVCQGDTWLKGFVPKLLATTQYKAGNTAVILWWDENSGSGTVPLVVISPYTHAVKYTGKLDHYNTLRTVQSLLGLPCLGASCSHTSYAAAFGLS